MALEICKLCLKEKEIQYSHLIPAGAFRALRARDNPNPNPLTMDGNWLGQTSEQVAKYTFCRECEHIFNVGGEDWVLPLLATLDGFPLYDMIAKAPTLEKDGEYFACPTSGIPEFDPAKMIHFAMSIFWKASVQNWAKKGNEIQIHLGPYGELFKQFVLGTGQFPLNTASSTGRCNTTGIKLFTKGGVYEACATGKTLGNAEERRLEALEGGTVLT